MEFGVFSERYFSDFFDRFENYFVYIVVVLGLINAIFILYKILRVIGKGRKDNNVKYSHKEEEIIEGGYVSIFFDVNNNVVIISYVKDKYGIGKPAGLPRFIMTPYNPIVLGRAIRSSMALYKNDEIISSKELMKELGYKSWIEFSKGRKNISLYFKDKVGLVLNTTRRLQDGSYQFNLKGYEKVLDPKVGNEELGTTVMQLVERCR